MGRLTFDTGDVPESERRERWEQHNALALIGLQCRTLNDDDLSARETILRLPALRLARVAGSPHVVERDAGQIRQHPTEAVALFFTLSGDSFFYTPDGVRTVRPGQLLIADADRPFSRGFSNDMAELVLTVGREAVQQISSQFEPRGLPVVTFAEGGDTAARTLARLVDGATRGAGQAPDEAEVLRVLGAILHPGSAGLAAQDYRRAADRYIRGHLTDPNLSADVVARAIGISARHLSRVLANDDSLPQRILALRLDAAHRLLSARGSSVPSVSEAAARCGFGSSAHFSRSFTARFGERPSQLRRRTLAVG